MSSCVVSVGFESRPLRDLTDEKRADHAHVLAVEARREPVNELHVVPSAFPEFEGVTLRPMSKSKVAVPKDLTPAQKMLAKLRKQAAARLLKRRRAKSGQ